MRLETLAAIPIGYVSRTMTLGHAIGVFAAAAYGVVILAAFTLPETKGRALLC